MNGLTFSSNKNTRNQGGGGESGSGGNNDDILVLVLHKQVGIMMVLYKGLTV